MRIKVVRSWFEDYQPILDFSDRIGVVRGDMALHAGPTRELHKIGNATAAFCRDVSGGGNPDAATLHYAIQRAAGVLNRLTGYGPVESRERILDRLQRLYRNSEAYIDDQPEPQRFFLRQRFRATNQMVILTRDPRDMPQDDYDWGGGTRTYLCVRYHGRPLAIERGYLRMLARNGWRGLQRIPRECIVRPSCESAKPTIMQRKWPVTRVKVTTEVMRESWTWRTHPIWRLELEWRGARYRILETLRSWYRPLRRAAETVTALLRRRTQ